MLLEPARHFAIGAAVGQHPYRRAGRVTVRRRIGVNRHQEVGILLTGNVRTAHHRNKVIAVAGHDRPEHRVGVQQRTQLAGNRDGHVLLFGAVRADRARILAAVAGVDRNNDLIVRRHRARGRARHGMALGHRRLPFVTR